MSNFTPNSFQVPNILVDKLMSELSGIELKCYLFVIRKTKGWNKEFDAISLSQFVSFTGAGKTAVISALKKLIDIGLLIKKIGARNTSVYAINMFETRTGSESELVRKMNHTSSESGLVTSSESEHTKNNIKNTIKNTPLTPQGESKNNNGDKFTNLEQEFFTEEKYIEQAEAALNYYNNMANSHCRDNSPFLKILEPQKYRNGWSLDDIKLVIRWVFSTWKKKTNSAPKPQSICRVTRFDGYLSDAKKWDEMMGNLNLEDVIEAFNCIFDGRYEAVELNEVTKQSILGLLPHMKNKTIDGFKNYFIIYNETASEYYDKFGFSFVMKPETLQKVREGAL